jgi:RhoGAP domain
MKDKKLFDPDPPVFSNHVIEMMDAFSNSFNYGDETDSPVNNASVADLCHLFRYFLDSLPSPPLEHIAFRILTDLCIIPSTIERRERGQERNSETIASEDMLENEEFRIVMAKLILRLLPESHFSTLIYLLAFLSQLPLCSVADLTIEKLSVMFGPSVCGPRDPLSYLEAEQTFPDDDDFKIDLHKLDDISVVYVESLAIDTLHWLLTHWDYISDGLLLEDYHADISSFQMMVAQVIKQKYAWDLGSERTGQNDAEGEPLPENQAQSEQRAVPVIPCHLYEDKKNMLVEEPEPDGLYDHSEPSSRHFHCRNS